MRLIKFIFLLLIIVMGITFASLNASSVTIHYYVGTTQLPLALLLVIALFIGALLGLLVAGYMALRLSLTARHWRRRAELAEKRDPP